MRTITLGLLLLLFSIVSADYGYEDFVELTTSPTFQLGENPFVNWYAPSDHLTTDCVYWFRTNEAGVQDASGYWPVPAGTSQGRFQLEYENEDDEMYYKFYTWTFMYKIDDIIFAPSEASAQTSASDISISHPPVVGLGEPYVVNWTAYPYHATYDFIIVTHIDNFRTDTSDGWYTYQFVPRLVTGGSLVFKPFDSTGIYIVAYWAKDRRVIVQSNITAIFQASVTVMTSNTYLDKPSIPVNAPIPIKFTTAKFHEHWDLIIVVPDSALDDPDFSAVTSHFYRVRDASVDSGEEGIALIWGIETAGDYTAFYLAHDTPLKFYDQVSFVVTDVTCRSDCSNSGTVCSDDTQCIGCGEPFLGTCGQLHSADFTDDGILDGHVATTTAGQMVTLTVTARDSVDPSNELQILSADNPWLSTIENSGTNPVSAVFKWNPKTIFSNKNIIITFQVVDKYGVVSGLRTIIVHVLAQYCNVWGSSHFKTFDGISYNFPGVGEYRLLYAPVRFGSYWPDVPFLKDIQVRQQPCTVGSRAACVSAIAFNADSEANISIYAQPDGKYEMIKNGEKVTLTYPFNEVYGDVNIVSDSAALGFVIYDQPELTIYYHGNSVQIRADPSWMNKVYGLCGYFNEELHLDLLKTTANLDPDDYDGAEDTYNRFGLAWKVPKSDSRFFYGPDSSYEQVNTLIANPIFATEFYTALLRDNANRICSNLVLSTENFDNCVMDVAIAEDTQVAVNAAKMSAQICEFTNTQEYCQAAIYSCPTACNLNGKCNNGNCTCNNGYLWETECASKPTTKPTPTLTPAPTSTSTTNSTEAPTYPPSASTLTARPPTEAPESPSSGATALPVQLLCVAVPVLMLLG